LTACKSNLKNLGTALEMYSTDWDGKYPSTLDSVLPIYLKTLPECPAAATMSYVAEFGPTASGNHQHFEDYYILHCSGHHHKAVSLEENYPKYNGVEGLIERQ
jgi:hypothetical protein